MSLRDLADPGRSTTEAWAIVLGEQAGTLDFDIKRAGAAALVGDLQVAIKSLEGSTVRVDRYLTAVTDWSRFILSPASGQGNPYDAVEVITDAEIDHLSGLADVLDARRPEVDPSPESVDGLLAAMTDLRTMVVQEEEIDGDLRLFLVDHLSAMISALIVVRVRGVQGVEQVLGRVVVNASTKPAVWERIKSSKFWTPFSGLLNLMSKLAGATEQAAQIAESVDKIRELTQGG